MGTRQQLPKADPLDAEVTKGVDVRVVGVAYDGSLESKHALASAQRFAHFRHATLRLIAAVPPLEWWVTRNIAPEELREWRCAEFRGRLERAAESLPAGLQHETVLRHGHPSDVLVHEAREGIDALFMGWHSRPRWAGARRGEHRHRGYAASALSGHRGRPRQRTGPRHPHCRPGQVAARRPPARRAGEIAEGAP